MAALDDSDGQSLPKDLNTHQSIDTTMEKTDAALFAFFVIFISGLILFVSSGVTGNVYPNAKFVELCAMVLMLFGAFLSVLGIMYARPHS